jgi:diacylglycerol kinase family enzyme
VVLTTAPRHAAELAARAAADGCELVVSVGGDGTMNEIASVLMDRGVILGLVPCGSGDGLALSLGLSRTIPRALQVFLTGRPRSIDTAVVNDRPFFDAVGLGYDAGDRPQIRRVSQPRPVRLCPGRGAPFSIGGMKR